MQHFISHAEQNPSKHEPFELGTVQWVRRPGEGGRDNLSSGFWKVSPEEAPEPFNLVSHGDETFLVLEGAIKIEPENGVPFTLKSGDSASFNDGTRSRWTILEPVLEFFVYS